jgi:sigma-70-like protein
MPTAPELLAAFDAIGGRARQVLVARVLEEKSSGDVGRWLGIPVEAVDVLLFRALAELEVALAAPRRVPPPAEPLPDAEERAAAWALANALDRGQEEARGPRLERRFALCKAMRAAPELKQALVVPPPPPPTLAERARRLLWLAIVIAAAVLYSRWTAR